MLFRAPTYLCKCAECAVEVHDINLANPPSTEDFLESCDRPVCSPGEAAVARVQDGAEGRPLEKEHERPCEGARCWRRRALSAAPLTKRRRLGSCCKEVHRHAPLQWLASSGVTSKLCPWCSAEYDAPTSRKLTARLPCASALASSG